MCFQGGGLRAKASHLCKFKRLQNNPDRDCIFVDNECFRS